MRAYSLAIVFGLLLSVLLGLQLFAPPTSANIIQGVSIEIDPETLNLMQQGLITVYIWLPAPYSVRDINVSSIRFDGQQSLPALRGSIEGDKMVVKFDASLVSNYIWVTKVYHMGTIPPQADYMVDIIVTGSLITGETFESEAYSIKIVLPQPYGP